MNRDISTHPMVLDFLKRVCAQVRSKAIHDDIRMEMLHHLEELFSEKIEEGMTEEKAIDAAIIQMGDPDLLSKQLNAAHQPKADWGVLTLVLCMIIIGGVTLLSLYSTSYGGISIMRKISFAAAGVAVMGVLYFMNYRRLLHFSSLIYAGGLLTLAATNWIGVEVNGAIQYIAIGGYLLNVYSAAPYLLIVAASGMLHRETANASSSTRDIYARLRLLAKDVAVYVIAPFFLFTIARATGYLVLYLISISALLLVYRKWQAILAGGGLIGLLLIMQTLIYPDQMSYLWNRHMAFLHRTEEFSYFILRSIEAIHDGGWWGQGIGSANRDLPSMASELTYSYLVYSLGWVFGIAVAVVALAFLLRIAKLGMQLTDGFAKGLVIGLTSLFAIQYSWTLFMCIGLLPILGGMQMPIMNWSSGTIIEMGAVGLLLGAYRRKDMLGRSSLAKNRRTIN